LTATLLSLKQPFPRQDAAAEENENVKLNAQPMPSNSFTATGQLRRKVKIGRDLHQFDPHA